MSHTIKIVVKSPGEHAEVREVFNELKFFQEIVGGYIEQTRINHPVLRDFVLICNEEGRYDKLAPNIVTMELMGGDIVGTFFMARMDEVGNFASLHDDEFGPVIDELNARSF